jgi:hypothetical protein
VDQFSLWILSKIQLWLGLNTFTGIGILIKINFKLQDHWFMERQINPIGTWIDFGGKKESS